MLISHVARIQRLVAPLLTGKGTNNCVFLGSFVVSWIFRLERMVASLVHRFVLKQRHLIFYDVTSITCSPYHF